MPSNDTFFDSIDTALTPEQAAQALTMAEQGDTALAQANADNGGAPAATPATEQRAPNAADPQPNEQAQNTPEDPANAVLLAKDGKHTIPYSKLEEARKNEQHWRAEAEAAQQKLAQLQAEATQRADAGVAPTATDMVAAQAQAAINAGADPDLFGDFSEEAMRAGIVKLVQQQVDDRVNQALRPVVEQNAAQVQRSHYEFIYQAHPNADSMVESTEFKAWVDSQPSVVRNTYWQLFDTEKGGTAQQIVEVFDAFVQAKGGPPAAPDKGAAQAAIAKAKAEPPASLSSIPGGRADGLTPQERMADMGVVDLYQAMENMSPSQIEAFLNKQM